ANLQSIWRLPSASFAANPDRRWILFCCRITPGDFYSHVGLFGKQDRSFTRAIVRSKNGTSRNVLTTVSGDQVVLGQNSMKRSARKTEWIVLRTSCTYCKCQNDPDKAHKAQGYINTPRSGRRSQLPESAGRNDRIESATTQELQL